MTNEQKAREIAAGTIIEGRVITYSEIKYEVALQAMQWKEKQLIDKACKFWEYKFPYIDIDTIKEFVDAMKGK